ncbi:hypothetical protein RGR602_CH03015 [Rhizobium gallicum bv. gallicum R602sp]|uniref:Uncharacterized protein n=1 Tax=Rhizobium gallicum bv. gallicum R602sp TaxID=1041138 RepID=A0A0B4X739_9HYPH|nr:hypothetical protein RGR602_CH03015 [Rhizobium gallicum bv. gallicum R602sp]
MNPNSGGPKFSPGVDDDRVSVSVGANMLGFAPGPSSSRARFSGDPAAGTRQGAQTRPAASV